MKRASGTQTSAFKRLQELPAIFRGGEVMQRFQWSSKTASHYLYLWRRRGLVQSLGGHSDVYANLLVDRDPDWGQALLAAMPSAVIIGVDALHRAGWTTQVPQRGPTVAVKSSRPVFKTDHFEIVPRDLEWFQRVDAGMVGDPREGLPVLHPAWALADMLGQADWGVCGLSPDDIEWTQISSADERQWRAACKALGLPETRLVAMAQSSRGHVPRDRPDQMRARRAAKH